MNFRLSAASIALCSVVLPTSAALAQTSNLPNYGGYQQLDNLFRVGIQVVNPQTNTVQQRSFQQNKIDGIIDYLDPSELQAALGNFYTQQSVVSGIFDIRGAAASAGYAFNSTALVIRVLNPDGTTLNQRDGTPCAFQYNGQTRQQSFNQFDADVGDTPSPTGKAILACLSRSLAQNSPVDPLAGNPFSLQSSLARSALDLSSGDSLIEQGGANNAGDPWIVGASVSSGSAGRFNMTRVDARVLRGFRVLEGKRALLKVDMPFSYSRTKGAEAFTGQVGIGMEVPVIAQRWSLEPRVGYGVVYSSAQGSVGHILQGTVASRYVLNGVGRGHFVIGNMVGYSSTLATPFTDYNLDPGVKSWVFRNGLAYELPLKLRAGGRMASLRASYNFTFYEGTKLYNNNFHEMTVSFGVRGREESVRAGRDLFRINFNTIQSGNFSAYTGGIGFRF